MTLPDVGSLGSANLTIALGSFDFVRISTVLSGSWIAVESRPVLRAHGGSSFDRIAKSVRGRHIISRTGHVTHVTSQEVVRSLCVSDFDSALALHHTDDISVAIGSGTGCG